MRRLCREVLVVDEEEKERSIRMLVVVELELEEELLQSHADIDMLVNVEKTGVKTMSNLESNIPHLPRHLSLFSK